MAQLVSYKKASFSITQLFQRFGTQIMYSSVVSVL
ncbi:unnamed protein product [Brassica oleracea]|uniref:(rape) hypothetical protein n=1 Tax=Brassica napus TaxID=3708 RepID=A0A816I8U0_BRANA|nr:unnamed protein product [Brassica napus]